MMKFFKNLNPHWYPGFALTIISLGFLLNYFINTRIAHLLSPLEFGDFGLVITAFDTFSLFILLGHDESAIKFVTHYVIKKQWGFLKGYLFWCYKSIFTVGTPVILSGILVIFGFILSHNYHTSAQLLKFEKYHPLLFFFWLATFTALFTYTNKILIALHHEILSMAIDKILQPVLFFILIIGFIKLLSNYYLHHLVLLYIMAVFLAFLLQIFLVFRYLPKPIYKTKPRYQSKKWLNYSFYLFILDLLLTSVNMALLLILRFFSEPHLVGYFYAIIVITDVFWLIGKAINYTSLPKLGSALAAQDYPQLQQTLENSTRTCAFFQTIVLIILIGFGKSILNHFGNDYAQAYLSMIIFGLSTCMISTFWSTTKLLFIADLSKKMTVLSTIFFILLILCAAIGEYYANFVGFTLGVLIAILYFVIGEFWLLKKYLGLNPI